MDQLNRLISKLSLTQRISILVMVLAGGAGLMAFVHWKHEGDFRPLYTSMAPEDAATVVQKLKETGVEHRLSDDGSAVSVPSAKLAESRLAIAAAGLPKTGRIGFELFDKTNFGATEFVEHINYKRALEGELERSVTSLAEVEQARVHLTLPKESVFLDQQQPAKASVMIKLHAGAHLSPPNVLAVTNLVASAVEGLSPDAVSVVDMDGTLLSRPKKAAATDGSEITAESMEVRQQLERNLVAKIGQTLEPLLGPNRFRAGASVDCDLTSGDQQEETLDPARSVMVSSQKTEDLTERASSGGIPGTSANLPTTNQAAAKTPGGLSRRTENITYQTSRVVRHTRIPQGVIRRMSLAVLLDQSVQWEGEGEQKRRVLVPPAPETLKTIKDLVAGVTGFNAERGDQLIVETLPFEASLNAEPPRAKPAAQPKPTGKDPAWLQFVTKYRELWVPLSLALGLLLVLVRVLFRATTRRKPVEEEIQIADALQAAAMDALPQPASEFSPAGHLGAPNDERLQLAERVRQLARRDPAAAKNVLRMWLQERNTVSTR
jgi:flagellar M-ring protein FliF